ncbi:AraC family transcriptional regulator [Ideonella sp.]|uniref:AraC family transcriptional regulator n=1 Tax=Ideonella sp. TaxID=1929293 RepID=UPI003BB503F5
MSFWNFPRGPASVRLLVDYAQARGHAGEDLLRGSGLTAAQLGEPESVISASQELAVMANLLKQFGDDSGIGLQVGLTYHLSAYGILGYGLMSSATGADALQLASRFLSLTYAYTSIAHRRERDLDVLTFEPAEDLPPSLQRFVVERAMGAACRLLRDVLGSGFSLADFRLRCVQPRLLNPPRALSQVLGATVQYTAAENRISMDHGLLAQPLPQANQVTAAMCERLCSELLAKRRTQLDTAAFVRAHLEAAPAGRPPSLTEIARMLNVSERTLKRRLHLDGVSFRTLSQTVRQNKAALLMAEGHFSLTEIAAELGFSDLSSFSQAYKRWSGKPPSAV